MEIFISQQCLDQWSKWSTELKPGMALYFYPNGSAPSLDNAGMSRIGRFADGSQMHPIAVIDHAMSAAEIRALIENGAAKMTMETCGNRQPPQISMPATTKNPLEK